MIIVVYITAYQRDKEYTEFKYDDKECNLKPTNEIKMI